jgi:signal peptidase
MIGAGTAGATPSPAVRIRTGWLDHAATVACVMAIGGVLAAGILTLAGYRVLVDRTNSMSPAIRAGDLVVTRKVPAESVSPHAVVTFPDAAHPGRSVTHRVIGVRRLHGDLMFETRGDANPAPEFWGVRASQRVREVRFHVPGAGRLVPWLTSVPIRMTLLFSFALLAAAAALRRIWA